MILVLVVLVVLVVVLVVLAVVFFSTGSGSGLPLLFTCYKINLGTTKTTTGTIRNESRDMWKRAPCNSLNSMNG